MESHFKWIKDIEETQNVTAVSIIADERVKVASLYDMIHPNALLLQFALFYHWFG
jgi:alkyl hydroperoxide reductase subunit AhpC